VRKIQIDKSSDISRVKKEILATQPIKIESFITDLDLENTVLVLETEWGYLREASSGKRYIGTKELLSCLFLCISNDNGEYFFAHLNSDDGIDFKPPISKFKSHKNLKALILGGIEKTAAADDSLQIFSFVLTQLKELAEYFNTTITLEGQKILTHNKTNTPEEKNWSHYNLVMDIAMNAFVFLYKTPINIGFLQDNFSPEDFIKPASVAITKKELLEFLNFLHSTRTRDNALLLGKSTLEAPSWLKPDKDYSNTASCQNAFYNALRGVISKTGFPLLETVFKRMAASWTHLTHVVLDIKSHTIHSIPAYTPTYLEAARHMIKSYPETSGYFKFYHDHQYQPVPFSKNFNEYCDMFWDAEFTSSKEDQQSETLKKTLAYLKLKNLEKLEKKDCDDVPMDQRGNIRNYLVEKKYLINYLASQVLLSIEIPSSKSKYGDNLTPEEALSFLLRQLMSLSIPQISEPLFNQSLLANRLYAFFGATGISCPGRGCAGRAPQYIAEYAIDVQEEAALQPITVTGSFY
jgi:hypothetical protein